jgi:hypothetical protein
MHMVLTVTQFQVMKCDFKFHLCIYQRMFMYTARHQCPLLHKPRVTTCWHEADVVASTHTIQSCWGKHQRKCWVFLRRLTQHYKYISARKILLKMSVIWNVAPCSLVQIDWHFRGPNCLHHQSNDHCPDDGGSKHPWNRGQLLPDYMAQHLRR